MCLGSVLQRISAGLDQDSSVNYSVPSSSSHMQILYHRNAHRHVYSFYFLIIFNCAQKVVHLKNIFNVHLGMASAFHRDEAT